MASTTYVLIGPAGSGKTKRLRALYRQALSATQVASLPRLLWLAPNRRAAQQTRQQLLETPLEACFSPGVATFQQFADGVLKFDSAALRPLGRTGQRFLLRDIVSELAERQRNSPMKIPSASGSSSSARLPTYRALSPSFSAPLSNSSGGRSGRRNYTHSVVAAARQRCATQMSC